MLNQILLFKMPDIYQIASRPHSEEAFDEMTKVLVLVLGLAIRGDNQAEWIEKIQQSLSEHVQARLVEHIKEVTAENVAFSVSESIVVETSGGGMIDLDTSSPSIVVSDCSFQSTASASTQQTSGPGRNLIRVKMDELNEFLNARLLRQVRRVVDERDEYLEMVIELKQDKEQLMARINQHSPSSIVDLTAAAHHRLGHDDPAQTGCSSNAGGVGGGAGTCNTNSDQVDSDFLGNFYTIKKGLIKLKY